jgi:hypothetical protein
MIKLDFNNDANNDDANTQAGFTMFIIADSGSEVNGVTIDLSGDIQSARHANPTGTWNQGTYYPRAGERIYRDFIQGISPSGVTITLWGLGVNRDCNITIWAFDDLSVGDHRIANWYANGTHILDTNFIGGTTNWPRYELTNPEDLYKWAFSGTATTDELGRIVLTSSRDPLSPAGEDFAFVNAIMVEPKGEYVPILHANRPIPLDGTEDAPIDTILEWEKGAYAETHDVYLGTDFNDVNDADRGTPLDVLVSQDHSTTTYDPPGFLELNTTYYWRIDEVNSAPDYTIFKGEVWSFTTRPVPNAYNPVPLDGAEGVPPDVALSWKKGELAETHDVYFGTNEAAVTDANRSNPLGVLVSQDQSTTTYDPPEFLELNTTYYWRIDEVNAAPDYTIFKGGLWSFTTYEPVPIWRVDARCFLDGPSGSFDDIAVKDPSIVYSGGKWHLFYTGRDSSMWRMGYANAASIDGLKTATHTFMSSLNGGGYFCAPQVFWFEAKGKWYLIYQSALGPTYSTNTDINNPGGWTPGANLGFSTGVVDYWCISDGNNVYCFYGPNDGSHVIKRRSITVANFPSSNWSAEENVCSDTFEAPHVYKNLADGKFYMMVEDITRHFELWTADNPGGTWTKVTEYWADKSQLVFNADHWTDQVSHGEIIRAGVDEKMEIDNIDRCEILIQGVVDGDYGDYGNIPYDLGIIRRCFAGTGDLDCDYDVDFVDFSVLASRWLQPASLPSGDIAPTGGDGIVDMQDLGLMLDNWLWGK